MWAQVWWLLAPNPFVILADAAPRIAPRYIQQGDFLYVYENDPLSQVSDEVRNLCVPRQVSSDQPPPPGAPVWPWGLGFDVLVGIGAVALAGRRLHTPSRRIARGVRIA